MQTKHPTSRECLKHLMFIDQTYAQAIGGMASAIKKLRMIECEFAVEEHDEQIASIQKMIKEIEFSRDSLKEFFVEMDQEEQEWESEQGPTVIGARVIEEDEFA